MKLKYGCKIAGQLVKPGHPVEAAKLEEVQKMIPGMQYREGSEFVAVQFAHLDHPTLMLRKDIEL